MLSIFNFVDYRKYMHSQFSEMPKAGYGQSRRLAEVLKVHTTLVSQVMKGKKTFTLEQAAGACEFFALNEMETDYFLLLVQMDRAGSVTLKRTLARQLDRQRAHAKELGNRLVAKAKLKEEDRAIFYSDWAYSAVRQLVSIAGFQRPDMIAGYFGFSQRRVKEILEFLMTVGLCVEKNGELRVGPATTHLEGSSPWVRLHHMNWREKSIDALSCEGLTKMHYTAPMTLSRADAEAIREMMSKFLEGVDKVIEPSPSECLYCLNMDWFEVTR